MYSVVLLMSMTTAPEAPSFGHRSHSCYGCCGGVVYSCSGCCGGVAYKSSCYGCCGGFGYTSGYYYGSYSTYSCQGYGIYGGASYVWPTPYYYSGSGCYGYGYPIVPAYGTTTPKVEEKKTEPKKDDPKKTYLPTSPNEGRVIVRLPADAKLYANGQLTTLTSSERDFTTPTLEPGRNFEYAMKIEYTRDGKTITDNQTVRVRAGVVSVVDFADQGQAASLVSSKISIRIPQGAKLFVENQPKELNGVSEFQSPKLQKGADYAYSFRVELTKDGKNLSQTQRVVFKGGEPVNVDFSEKELIQTASK